MNKKIIYAILILIIIISAVLVATIGFKVDTAYDENTRIYVYIGKNIDSKELQKIVEEVFETKDVKVQKVEVYEDMACITIPKQEDTSEKIETLNNKINEKFEVENKKEDIEVKNQPKADIYSVVKPYIWPVIISTILILIYASIMYRKLGIIKTIAEYLLATLAPESTYVIALILAKLPCNALTIAIALVIYSISIISLTITKQKQLETYKLNQKSK